MAALSRAVCGIRDRTLYVTLPGSPKGARENLSAIMPVLPHALKLLKGVNDAHPVSNHGSAEHACVHSHASHSDTPVTSRHRTSPFPMVSVQEALSIIDSQCKPMAPIEIPVDLLEPGMVIAADVYSSEDLPPFRASIVDGYAVAHMPNDENVFHVASISIAGNDAVQTLSPGFICRVSTGAPVPSGAVAVVMVEDTVLVESEGDVEKRVQINASWTKDQNIRAIGSDVSRGTPIIKKYTQVSALGGEVGLLASVGIDRVPVIGKPTVCVLSTGNEVVKHSDELTYGKIRDSNRPALLFALRNAGYNAVDLGIVRDE